MESRGFTLVEVLFAGTILVIAAVSLAAGMANGVGLTETAREDMVARNAVRAAFATLSATPFPEVASLYQRTGFPIRGLTAVPGDSDGLPGRIELSYGPDGETTCYTVTIRVRWRGRTGERTLESVHYLANVRGDAGDPPPLDQISVGTGLIEPIDPGPEGTTSPTEDPTGGTDATLQDPLLDGEVR